MSVAIWWIRRDLRLGDNQALAEALGHSDVVLPTFILDPKLLASPSACPGRLNFLFDGLEALDADLHRLGSRLVVRKGVPVEVFQALVQESGACSIFAEADRSPYARKRDAAVSRELPLRLTPGVTVHPVESLHKADGSAYTVFTPFSRRWHSLPFPGTPIPAPDRLAPPPALASLEVPEWSRSGGEVSFPAGEAEAQRRLERFRSMGIGQYADQRNRLDLEGTSGISPYLRLGMLSARQAEWVAREAYSMAEDADARRGAETWMNELAWREFYAAILFYFPFVRRLAFRQTLRNIAWREAEDEFTAWAEGRTGYPVVDAGMRQLNHTGWMHNRARMLTASFLTKDLLIDWRRGERYFMQHLLDGDPASNNGGWQWTAGTGTDAAPYFRVFNPVLQGKKFDSHGEYIRRWLPELSAVPQAFIHAPWEMSKELQNRVGCLIGRDYPAPIVDHAFARQRVLDAYHRGY